MPKLQLTKRNIDKLPYTASGQVDYFDTELKGFMLRVGRQSKTFYVQADVFDPVVGDHKTVKEKIGRYGEWTPDQASKEAAKLLRQIRTGERIRKAHIPTLAQMLDIHLHDNQFRPGTVRAYRAELPAKFAEWLDLPLHKIGEIPPDVIIDRFRRIEKEHGPMAVKNSFGKLQALLNYARLKYPHALPRNPCAVLSDGKLWPKTQARSDCLRGNDFKTFHDGVHKFNSTTRDAILFCLYQGLRNKEAAALQWDHVDLDKEMLVIPVTKTKILIAPLSRQTVALLKLRYEAKSDSGFVFPSTRTHLNKTGHVALLAQDLRKNTGLDITLHGLRRSFVTIGKKLKLHEETERLVNHADNSVTGKHYDCRDVDDLREPLQRIANEIERLMLHGAGAKVIEIGTAKQAA